MPVQRRSLPTIQLLRASSLGMHSRLQAATMNRSTFATYGLLQLFHRSAVHFDFSNSNCFRAIQKASCFEAGQFWSLFQFLPADTRFSTDSKLPASASFAAFDAAGGPGPIYFLLCPTLSISPFGSKLVRVAAG